MATRDSRDYHRERTYLHKVRLCENLPRFGECKYGANCMYAHTLKDLRVPDEGRDAGFPWYEVWKAKKVHRWYGQSEMPDRFYHLLRVYVSNHLARGEEVPDWAIGANAWFNGIAPPWRPKQCDFNLAYDIEQLRIKRGGKLPPNVYPLTRFMRDRLSDLANEAAHAGPGGAEPESEHPQVEPWSEGEGQSEPAAAAAAAPESGSTATWSSWKCNTCGVLNYAWRDVCYGCHKPFHAPPNWPAFLFT